MRTSVLSQLAFERAQISACAMQLRACRMFLCDLSQLDTKMPFHGAYNSSVKEEISTTHDTRCNNKIERTQKLEATNDFTNLKNIVDSGTRYD